MSKIIMLKRIQKIHTEEEMRNALQLFIEGKFRLHIPVDDDDADIVLADGINELLDARESKQKIIDRAQAALNTSPHYPSVLTHALEDIVELCKEQLKEA